MYEVTEVQDCLIIAKKFERAMVFSTSERSGFALLSPVLDGIRVQSKNYINQAEAIETISTPMSASENSMAPGVVQPGGQAVGANSTGLLGQTSSSNPMSNLDKADEKSPNFGDKIAGQFGLLNKEGNFNMSGLFDSKCIPCGLRMDDKGMEAFFTKLGTGLLGGISEYLNFWQSTFFKQLQQLQNMLKLFNNTEPYMDLCAFIKLFTEFMCLPDLARIISTLTATMNKQSFKFSGILDLIMQFVGPLITPFLSNLVSTLEQFIMMVIKPIECIIDSIQAMLAKLDYNVLFKNIEQLDKTLDLGGPKQGEAKPDPRGDYMFRLDKPRVSPDEPKLPWIDGHIPRSDIVDGRRVGEFDFNMAGPLGTAIKAENASEQKAIETAAAELVAVRNAGKSVDGANPKAISAQRAKERTATKKYRGAVEKKNTSAVGRANNRIDETQASIKSSLVTVIQYLREGVEAVQGFFDFIYDEFKKIMAQYLGGGDNMIAELLKKNALSQMINTLISIYKALEKGKICEDNPKDIKVESWIPEHRDFKVFTDEDGKIHIEGGIGKINSAIDAVVEAVGVQASKLNPSITDKGGQPDTASQKLKSMIEFTGDPVLDVEIARTTEQLTTPVNVVYKCPLNTTTAQTEQINQWIRSVNS